MIVCVFFIELHYIFVKTYDHDDVHNDYMYMHFNPIWWCVKATTHFQHNFTNCVTGKPLFQVPALYVMCKPDN